MQQYRGKQQSGRQEEFAPTRLPGKDELEAIIGGDVKTLVLWAQTVGEGLKNERLTTSQVRGFFGEVRQIEAMLGPNPQTIQGEAYKKLVLLKPKLMYQAQRQREQRRNEAMGRLADLLTRAIDMVSNDVSRFRNFVDFFEAILAYHKATGGRD